MYRIVFADDEHIVREGISTRVGWGENGFELCAVCSNGREVLDYLEDNEVDVLLSDISMPLLDGLAVCREVSQRYPDTMLLLLTGYDQFEYAQEALKYQVRSFLLKPITAAELENVLAEVKLDLDRKTAIRKEQAELRARLAESLPVLKERFLHRLVLGQLTADVMRRRASELQWEDHNGHYRTVIVDVPPGWDEISRLGFTEAVGSLLSRKDELFFNAEENIVLLLQDGSGQDLESRTSALAPGILRSSGRVGKAPVSVALGEIVDNVGAIQRSYDGARRALGHARLLGLPHVVSASDVSSMESIEVNRFHELARALVGALRQANRNAAIEILDGVSAQLGQHYVEPESADAYLSRIQFLLLDFVDELILGPGDLMPANVAELLYPRHFTTVPEALAHYRTVIERVLDILEQRRTDAVTSRMARAEDVIRVRHAESGLSLQDVCDEVFLSVSQFSALFKEQTGKTFVEYLTNVRIEHAKDLLRTTDLRTYEIAERVGYSDPRYFTYVFKKMTGMTSSEYRGSA